ncbi:hypothetical protein WAJ24_23370, partial [Acinetobacter baumannii]
GPWREIVLFRTFGSVIVPFAQPAGAAALQKTIIYQITEQKFAAGTFPALLCWQTLNNRRSHHDHASMRYLR